MVLLLAHHHSRRPIVLIAVPGNMALQRGHHTLRIGIVERLQLGVVALLAHLFEAIGHHALVVIVVLLLAQVAAYHHVLLDQGIGALIKLGGLVTTLRLFN